MEVRFEFAERLTKVAVHCDRQTLIPVLKDLVLRDRGIVFLDRGLGKIWKQKIVGFGIPAKNMVLLKEGERSKEWHVIGAALEYLAKRAHERSAPLIVIGGGAACDAGALVASLYRRGVPLILVPTTLLAMVDAAIGGKTAVDLVRGGKILKNVAGTFYPADQVHFWPGWLASLGLRERLSGVGELVKTLWLAGEDIELGPLGAWVRGEVDVDEIWPLVEKAVLQKAKIVASDPLDKIGVRSALNYGHTLGHAFESLAKGKLAHGEAIAWGMWAESAFLGRKGSAFAGTVRDRIDELGFAPPEFLRGIEPGAIISYLRADKKASGGKIEMKVLSDFGTLETVRVHPHELAKFAANLAQEL